MSEPLHLLLRARRAVIAAGLGAAIYYAMADRKATFVAAAGESIAVECAH